MSPCGMSLLDTVGPTQINANTSKITSVNFHVPKDACLGEYTFTLEAYIDGVLIGTANAELTVSSSGITKPTKPGPGSGRGAGSTIRLD